MKESWSVGNLTVKKGEKVKGYLALPSIKGQLPAILINDEQEGSTVLVMGGIHGCEYTSIDAAYRVASSLDPQNLKGKVIVLPIVNTASFYARSIYVHPNDQKNLNRMFPGNKDGTDAERLAFWLKENVFTAADFIIDLHGGDMIEALVPFSIYHDTNHNKVLNQSKEMASLFDVEFVIKSSGQVPGSTYGCASEMGIPAIIAEAGQQGILTKKDSQMLRDGVLNILTHLSLLEGEVKQTKPSFIETFDWYRSDIKGLWYPNVEVGKQVKKGELIGVLKNELGEVEKEVYSKTNGVVLFLVTSLAININDPLLAIGG